MGIKRAMGVGKMMEALGGARRLIMNVAREHRSVLNESAGRGGRREDGRRARRARDTCVAFCVSKKSKKKSGGRTGHVQVNCSSKSPRTNPRNNMNKSPIGSGRRQRNASSLRFVRVLVPRKRSRVLKNQHFVVTRKKQPKPFVPFALPPSVGQLELLVALPVHVLMIELLLVRKLL